jgi:hypothetical protein
VEQGVKVGADERERRSESQFAVSDWSMFVPRVLIVGNFLESKNF